MTRWLAEWRSLAPLSRFGVLVLVVGAAADAVAHLSAGGGAIGFTPAQHSAHLVILIGMLSTLIGIVLNAIWPARSQRSLRK